MKRFLSISLAILALYGPANAQQSLPAIAWDDLAEFVTALGVQVGNEELGVTACPSALEIANQPADRVVMQWIENTFYRWEEYDLGGDLYCVVMLTPEFLILTVKEAQTLLSASRMWNDQPQPPAAKDALILDANDPSMNFPPVAEPIHADDGCDQRAGSTALEDVGVSSPLATKPHGEPDQGPSAKKQAPERALNDPVTKDVIGDDDRVGGYPAVTYPWNTVSYVTMTKAGSNKRATAFLVSPYTALTNGHVVYDQATNTWATNVVIAPGQSDDGGLINQPYGARSFYQLVSNTNYTSGSSDTRYDYGGIRFITPFPALGTYMPLVFNYDLDNDITTLNNAGYPATAQGISTNDQWSSYALSSSLSSSTTARYYMDTSSGNNGGPVWIFSSGNRSVVAIHCCGFGGIAPNGGPRLHSGNQSVLASWLAWTPSIPGLIVVNPFASLSTLTPGQIFTIGATVLNQGTGDSNPTILRYFQSTDSIISTSDTQLGSDTIPGLSVTGSSSQILETTAPGNDGSYWVGACLDSVSDEFTIDKQCSDAVQINVRSPAPDLTPYQPAGWSDKIIVSNEFGTSTDSASLSFEDSLYIDWSIANIGDLDSPAVSTIYALYLDNALVAQWSYAASISSMPGSFIAVTDYELGPLAEGNYSLRLEVDTGNTVTESNENNNSYTRSFSVAGSGFCPDVVPLPDDPLEADNDLSSAHFLGVPSSAAQPHNFNSNLDEDWIRFEGRATPTNPQESPILYLVQAFNFGSGIRFDNPVDPMQGTGIRLELIDLVPGKSADTLTPVVLQSTLGRCGEGGLDDGAIGEELAFEVPHDGTFWIRVSQCRNDPFDLGFDPIVYPQSCIPNDASYDLQIRYGDGFQPGFLTGMVRNINTGEGIIGASINSIDINNATFSAPGYGAEPDGIYKMSDTRTRDIAATATVMADGFQPRTISFNLGIDLITTCDIDLTPGSLFADGFEDLTPSPAPLVCPPPPP